MNKSYTIAYFISPHGLGHAARAAAVMEEIYRLRPETCFEIFTLVPKWFFKSSLPCPFGHHPILTDIGLVQRTPLIEDIQETMKRLDNFLPFNSLKIKRLSRVITQLGCDLIICDISPLGISIAKEVGVPSLLVENFTWDWIYQGYSRHIKKLNRHITYLRNLYSLADYHIQTEPICNPSPADLKTSLVSRRVKIPSKEIRKRLNIPSGAKMVMFTISGAFNGYNFLEGLERFSNIHFIIPITTRKRETRDNIVLLPHKSGFFHPDLVNASDATIGKLGYSTVAEVYHAGVPFGYVIRKTFRESQRLDEFCKKEMNCFAIDEREFTDGRWLSNISELLERPRIKRNCINGAIEIAEFIINLLKG